MSLYLRQLRHLLPSGEAWKYVAKKTLWKFLEGVAEQPSETRDFVDSVWAEIFPDTTASLVEHERQFGIIVDSTDTDTIRRQQVAAAWAAQGGQSPSYIQTTLQAAGFDIYIHEWWWTGFDIETASYDEVTFSVASQESIPWAIDISPDGSKLYVLGAANNTVYQYTFGTPHDTSTLSYDGVSFDVSDEESQARGLAFSPDGAKMYIVGLGSGRVHQYTLSTPREVDTASPDGVSFDVSNEDDTPNSISFKPDGTRFYVLGDENDAVFEYDIETPWEIDTSQHNAVSLSVAAQETTPRGMAIGADGARLYIVGSDTDTIYQYELPVRWTLADGAHGGSFFSVGAQESVPSEIVFSSDGRRLFLIGGAALVRQYSVSVASREYLARDPREYTTVPLVGSIQCGEALAQCGEPAARGNRFLANEPGYIVNLNRTPTAPPLVPDDPDTWPYFLYFGGPVFGQPADIPETRRPEFERLLLKIAPAQHWIVVLVDYFQSLTTEGGDFLITEAGDQLIAVNAPN